MIFWTKFEDSIVITAIINVFLPKEEVQFNSCETCRA